MQFQRSVEQQRGTGIRPGFTLIEVLMVLVIMGLLGAVTVPQISMHTSQRSVMNARDAFIRAGAQARAAAIQTGDQVELRIEPTVDRVTAVTAAGDTVFALDLRNGPIQANLVGTAIGTGTPSSDLFRVCYVPRGYAQPVCGSDQIPRTVTFASPTGRHTSRVTIRVGQMEHQ